MKYKKAEKICCRNCLFKKDNWHARLINCNKKVGQSVFFKCYFFEISCEYFKNRYGL